MGCWHLACWEQYHFLQYLFFVFLKCKQVLVLASARKWADGGVCAGRVGVIERRGQALRHAALPSCRLSKGAQNNLAALLCSQEEEEGRGR